MIWLGIVIGIIVMQLMTYILAFITDENLDVVVPFSVFVFYLMMLPIYKLVRVIKRHKRKNKLKGDK